MARTGPTSAISAKNTRNAIAVQTTPSTAMAASTLPGGRLDGRWVSPSGV